MCNMSKSDLITFHISFVLQKQFQILSYMTSEVSRTIFNVPIGRIRKPKNRKVDRLAQGYQVSGRAILQSKCSAFSAKNVPLCKDFPVDTSLYNGFHQCYISHKRTLPFFCQPDEDQQQNTAYVPHDKQPRQLCGDSRNIPHGSWFGRFCAEL